MKQHLISLLLMTACWKASSNSLGVVGEVFPVTEKSFLVLIEERLTALEGSGEWDALKARWIETVVTHTNRPTPLNLPRTLKTSTHYYKPEIVLAKTITDSLGRVLYPKGTRVNALEELPFYSPCWLFFNADDEAQLKWAQQQRNQCANPKLILTGGAVSLAEKKLQAVIYFDQAGRISRKLNIAATPTRVTRFGNALQITALAIKESGDVF